MSQVCSMFNRSGIHRPSNHLATEIRHESLPKSQWNRHDDLITIQTITKRSASVWIQCKSNQLLDVQWIVFLRFGTKTVPCYARPFAAIGIRSGILRTCGHNSKRAVCSACDTPFSPLQPPSRRSSSRRVCWRNGGVHRENNEGSIHNRGRCWTLMYITALNLSLWGTDPRAGTRY